MAVSLAELARATEPLKPTTPEVVVPSKVIIFDRQQLLETLESFPHPRVDPDFQKQLERLKEITRRTIVPESAIATTRLVGIRKVADDFLEVSHHYFTMATSYKTLGEPRVIKVQADTVESVGFAYDDLVFRLYQIEDEHVIQIVSQPPADSYLQDPEGRQRYILNPTPCHIPIVL